MVYDIFISYKNDGEGSNFSARLRESLVKSGYSVYFNPNEQRAGDFGEQLIDAICGCTDFILILSEGCLRQLMENRRVDWVREEVLTAKEKGKNIIPLLIGKAKMPEDKSVMPEALQFLPDQQAVRLPEQYMESPYLKLLTMVRSKPERTHYQNEANGNPEYHISEDMRDTLKRAEQGDPEAMYEIGFMYYHGFASLNSPDGQRNPHEAFQWLKRVSESKYVLSDKADLLLAKMYYAGEVPREPQSFRKSLEYRTRGDKEKTCVANEALLFAMAEGIERTFDYEKITRMIDSELTNLSDPAKKIAADFYIRYGEFEKAVNILEQMNEEIADAEYKLGELYLYGLHCDPPRPDPYRAEHHFSVAVEAGMAEAIHKLGLLNFRGAYGYRQNLSKARRLYKEAAEQGHRDALYDYAWMCRYGLGGERDITEAIKYFKIGAEQGHYLCMVELAVLYQEPECRDYEKAFEWAVHAANSGDAYSEFVLGNLYFFGRGCRYNPDEAVMHYRKALSLGINEAEFMLKRIESADAVI